MASEQPITFGSLFAGIGGFDLGFERAGMQCRWQVEIDDYATRVLAKHWPNVRRWDDVRTWPQPDTERVDVICGGFPCQDISVANTGQPDGIDGDRSGLFFEFVRVIQELRPTVSVMENVPAILVRGVDRVLGTLAEIGCDAEWICIPSRVCGTPHKRMRWLLVAYPSGSGRKRPVADGGIPKCAKTTYPVDGHRTVDTWSALVRGGGTRRSGDGVSVAMDRRRLRGLGNAVVPQVAEWVGRRVVEFLRAETA